MKIKSKTEQSDRPNRQRTNIIQCYTFKFLILMILNNYTYIIYGRTEKEKLFDDKRNKSNH